jgi:hypothetical protein
VTYLAAGSAALTVDMDHPDTTLYLGLATAIATSLGAAIKLRLLQQRDRALPRIGATLILSIAVLGMVAALIAVGKGHSDRVLTWAMFAGLCCPATYAFAASLSEMLDRRWERAATAGVLFSLAAVLLLVTSPSVLHALFSPRDLARERRDAEARAERFYHPGRTYECTPTTDRGVSNCAAGGARVSFNDYTNSSVEGDERRFVTGNIAPTLLLQRETSSSLTFNSVEVSRGDEVRVRVYFRNGAVPQRGDVKAVTTRNARVGVFVSRTASAGNVVLAVLYADNASPRVIAGRVAFVSSEPFRLTYIPESARLVNRYSGQGGIGTGLRLPDAIVGDLDAIHDDPRRFKPTMGTPIGYSKLDGRIGDVNPYNQQGWVWLRFRVR